MYVNPVTTYSSTQEELIYSLVPLRCWVSALFLRIYLPCIRTTSISIYYYTKEPSKIPDDELKDQLFTCFFSIYFWDYDCVEKNTSWNPILIASAANIKCGIMNALYYVCTSITLHTQSVIPIKNRANTRLQESLSLNDNQRWLSKLTV